MFTVGNVDRYIDCYIGRRSGRHSIDTRSILDRHSIDTRSTVDRHSVDSRSPVGRYLADTSPILGRPTLGRHLADIWPILHRYLTDTPPILDRYLTNTRHNHLTHYWRSRDLKHISLRTKDIILKMPLFLPDTAKIADKRPDLSFHMLLLDYRPLMKT